MTHDSDLSPPSDVCLLLRAHAEQRWLILEVSPVLRQLQQPGSIPEEQLGAALAYLEVLSIEAAMRAAETDATYAQLEACKHACEDRTLPGIARRYHAAVRTLRDTFARHIAMLLAAPSDISAREHSNS
jgi:hypothetical protein